nr:retrovirus-related Pol polyprotein from transposon TNT 1-94 [Tanacetum cinerariifolium]
NGGAVDWKSTKQSIFATSSTDAEYIAAFNASKEAVWIRKFIYGLGIVPTIEEPISMYCDNTGAIAIAKDDGITKGLPEFADDTIIDYSRPTPSIESNTTDSLEVIKTNKVETARNSSVKYAEMYRNTSKSPKVKGNSQNNIEDKGYLDSGCSRHMTSNISYLSEKRFKLKDDTNVLIRTPRQHNMYSIDLNNVVPHKNLTCLVAKASADETRTMLADAKLPVTFWAKAVNTACYVQNKTTMGKFGAKGDEGYFVGYSMSSKEFRVFNKRTKRVEENLHVDFLENKLIEKGAGPNWLFDIDTLTNFMNYVPVVVARTSSTNISAHMESSNSDAQDAYNANVSESSGISNPTATSKILAVDQMESLTVESVIPIFEDTIGVETDLSNMESSIIASSPPTFRIHKDHPKSQIIGLVDTPV